MRNEERKRGVAFRKRGIASNKIKRRSKAKGGTLIVWHVSQLFGTILKLVINNFRKSKDFFRLSF